MSDQQQGPGWWLASDGRWYPPESHPAAPIGAPSPPQKSGVESFGEALSSLGCALTLVGFGVLAVILVLVLVL